MEFPKHLIPQTWMRQTKVLSYCDTWVFTAPLWGKRYSFFLDPSTFQYERTGLPYKRQETLPSDIASHPEDLHLDSFTIAGASKRCDKFNIGSQNTTNISCVLTANCTLYILNM